MTIGGKRALTSAKAQFTRDLTALYGQAAGRVAGVLRAYAGADGTIPRRQQSRVLAEADVIMARVFTANDGRTVYSPDEPTRAASPFADILNKALVAAVRPIVESHAAYMRRVMPEDLQRELEVLTRAQFVQEQGPGDEDPDRMPGSGFAGDVPTSRVSAQRRAFLERYQHLRIFSPNPWADYESAHTWVDPRGYQLSDRIWRAGQRTRGRVDALLAEGIRQGRSAAAIAADLERFLLPNRAGFRTRVYGADASFDAMRLARSEITRAHSMAALYAARANPYVDGMDYALSPSHPQFDICDGYATIGMGGGRLRPPYRVGEGVPVPVQDSHPQCLCVLIPSVSARPAQVTAELRGAVREARELYLSPHLTPLEAGAFVEWLLGRHLAGALVA